MEKKAIVYLVAILFFVGNGLVSCSLLGQSGDDSADIENVNQDDNIAITEIEFEEKEKDFGNVVQGEKVVAKFKYKNVGENSLLIKSAQASCGCTRPKFSREPLQPGGEGEIEVVFDSSGRSNKQYKTVKLECNTKPSTIQLSFTADIVEPKPIE